jgi:hypothetical protein
MMRASVVFMSISGHIPVDESARVRRDNGMMMPVSGMAMRLVRRKWVGNEWK